MDGAFDLERGPPIRVPVDVFRVGIRRDPASLSSWTLGDLYPAHFALSDVDTGRFLHYQKLRRTSPGVAGLRSGTLDVWNQQWRARLEEGRVLLQAGSPEASIDLELIR